MCVVCHSLRPWSRDCAHAGLDGGVAPLEGAGASAGRASLSAAEIGARLLTDYWNIETPRSFDARAGDALTFDVGGLTSAGRGLARAALEEWGTVTGLRFREVEGGFRPDAVRTERGDASASTRTTAEIALNEAFEGRIGSGDRDWVRLDLPSAGTLRLVVEGAGAGALRSPGLALYDANGRALPIGIQHFADRAEVQFGLNGGGGVYYAQVLGHGGNTGGYRISAREPGAAGTADITFDDARPGAFADTAFTGSTIHSADINVGTEWLERHGTTVGSYAFQTYLHEIGHALGLGHPGDYEGDASFSRHAEFANDSWQTTVMSYFDQRDNPNVDADKAYAVTPMAGDLEAIRTLYGRAEIREGDTIYGHRSTAGGALDRVAKVSDGVAFTIVDTGGHDRIDLTRESGDQRVDLRPGASSDVFGHRGAMTIAEGTRIEAAWSGRGDDVLRGAGTADDLRGGSGKDRLYGGGGDDRLEGGRGDDLVKGGSGDDRLRGQEDDDKLKGGSGDDHIRGESGRDKVVGGDGHDRLEGGEGKDKLKGGDGADVFVFGRDFGRDKVKDFDGSEGDRIDLSDVSAIRSFRDLVEDHLRERGDKLVIRGGEDGAIKLGDLAIDELMSDHFLF